MVAAWKSSDEGVGSSGKVGSVVEEGHSDGEDALLPDLLELESEGGCGEILTGWDRGDVVAGKCVYSNGRSSEDADGGLR